MARWLRVVGPDAGTTVLRGGVALLLAVRTLTLFAAILLGVLAVKGEGASVTVPLASLTATGTLVTSAVLLRHPAPGARLLTSVVVFDVLALDVAVVVTGGADSPLRLLVSALPIAAAFTLPWPSTLGLGLLAAAAPAATADDGREALAILVSVLPGVVVAAAVARRRDAIFERLRALAFLRQDVLLRPSLEWHRVGTELDEIGLRPVREVLGAMRRDASGPAVAALAPRVRDAAAAVRSVVSELHALSARPTNLPVALRELTLRRAPDAVLDLRLEHDVLDPELERLVLAVARDALAQLVRPSTRGVCIALREDELRTLVVDVEVDPPRAPSGGEGGAVLAERAERTGGWVRAREGGLRIALPGAVPRTPPSARLPGGTRADALGLLVLGRTAGLVGTLVSGIVAGGAAPLFYGAVVAGIAVAPFHARIVRAGLGPFLALALADWVLFGVLSATLDGARDAVLPIAVGIPVYYAFVLRPADTLAAGLAAGVAVAVGGAHDERFLLAFGWATLVAAMLATGLNDLRTALDGLEERHRGLLGRLLDEEEQRRRELAADLHDDALQLLLAARQELEAAASDPDAAAHAQAALAEGAVALARAVGEVEVDQGAERLLGGLTNALATAMLPVRRRTGAPRLHIVVDEDAGGLHDGLLVRLARELATNAAKHAAAAEVHVRVERRRDAVVLEVEDDGAGFDVEAVGTAVARGHVGLAFVGERVRAAGGTTELGRGAAGGALVRVTLPAPEVAASPAAGAAAPSAAGAPA